MEKPPKNRTRRVKSQSSAFYLFVGLFFSKAFDIKILSEKKRTRGEWERGKENVRYINECIIHNAFKMKYFHAVYVLFMKSFYEKEQSKKKTK